jgi:hypothetical protein
MGGAFRLAIVALAAWAFGFATAGSAWAQSCGGSAGPSIAGGASSAGSWLKKGELAARLSEEYEHKDRTFEGAHSVVNDFDESLFIRRTALDVRFGVTDDWSLELTPTYSHFTYRVKPPFGARFVQEFRGFGDTLVAVGRKLASEGECAPRFGIDPAAAGVASPAEAHGASWLLTGWVGLWTPTGEAERPDPRIVTRDVSVANLQTGSGTFDPFLRLRYERTADPFSLFAELDVRWPVGENRYDYRTADSEAVVVGAAMPVVSRVAASLSVMGQRVGRDQFDGEDVGVGGARWIYLVPGAIWQVTDAAALDLSVRIPVYRRTDTKLVDGNAAFQLGLTWRF